MALPKITINRTTWLRGDGNGKLLDEHGMMCCIGQACEQLGVSRDDLLYNGAVADLINGGVNVPKQFSTVDKTALTHKCGKCGHEDGQLKEKDTLLAAYEINDSRDTSDAYKEEALVPVFAQLGLAVEFVN